MQTTRDMSDRVLIARGHIEELIARFGSREFIVRRSSPGGVCEWVETIDTHDGKTTWTSDPRHARIFRGGEWVRVWGRPGLDLLSLDSLPTF